MNSHISCAHRLVVGLFSMMVFGSFTAFAQWVPPIGIPAPPFGISETHGMYGNGSDARWNYGNGLEAYRTNQFGPYTHYIDNTHPSATDTSNTFGSPDRPRRTWPYPLPAGSAVQVHGGPYNFVNGPG